MGVKKRLQENLEDSLLSFSARPQSRIARKAMSSTEATNPTSAETALAPLVKEVRVTTRIT
jgi:hypothetical protein